MAISQAPRKRLPEKPSEENLRKQAKQLAKHESVQLAAAQRRLANEYGYKNWAELMRAVATRFVPILALRELVVFPLEVYAIYVGRPKSVNAIDAVAAGSPILLVAQRDAAVRDPSADDMHEVGTLGVIVERQSLSDGTAKIVVEGRKRARAKRFVLDDKYYKAEVEEVADSERVNLLDVGLSRVGLSQPLANDRARALWRAVVSALNNYIHEKRKTVLMRTLDDPAALPYMIARHLDLPLAQQQALLDTVDPVERLEKILAYLQAPK